MTSKRMTKIPMASPWAMKNPTTLLRSMKSHPSSKRLGTTTSWWSTPRTATSLRWRTARGKAASMARLSSSERPRPTSRHREASSVPNPRRPSTRWPSTTTSTMMLATSCWALSMPHAAGWELARSSGTGTWRTTPSCAPRNARSSTMRRTIRTIARTDMVEPPASRT